MITIKNYESNDLKKYYMANPPYLHLGFTKNELMQKTLLMMSIIAFGSVVIMGLPAFIHIIIALGVVLIVYGIVHTYQIEKGRKPTYESPASLMVTGMIVGLAMPIASPYEVTAGVALLTIIVFKYIQGKYFERKYLNPVAAAKTLLLVGLSLMFVIENSLNIGMIFHTHHLNLNLLTAEGFENSMWIFQRESFLGIDLSATLSLMFWQTHGWIGGACGVLVLIVGSIATYWLRYKWRIVVATMGTMTILAIGIGIFTGGDPILRIAFHVFTGSVIFMVFFMATEPQSTPMPERSQYLFGIALSILTFVFQLINVLGGSIIALVLLNMVTPFLDRIWIKTPFGHRKSKGGA